MSKLLKWTCIFGIVAAFSVPCSAQVGYTVKDLGNFMPTGMNSTGEVVGYGNATVSGPDHSYFYSNGTTQDLGTFGGAGSRAFGINDSGQVVGFIEGADGASGHAFLYQNGSVTDMNSLIDPNCGLTLLGAEAINNKGQIAGICRTASGEEHVFLYDHGTVSDWNVPGAYDVTGLNNAGQIVGNYKPSPSENHGFLLTNGVFTDIASPDASVCAVGPIMADGTILGGLFGAGGQSSGFLYKNGQYSEINAGGATSCYDMNDNGQIVGTSTSFPSFLYDKGQFVDVKTLISPDLGLTLGWAYCINNNGQIVASGQYPGDTLGRMFLLSPVPEPSTLILIAVATASAIVFQATIRFFRRNILI